MIGLLSSHELEHRYRVERVSLAKKAAALFRISRSSRLRLQASGMTHALWPPYSATWRGRSSRLLIAFGQAGLAAPGRSVATAQ